MLRVISATTLLLIFLSLALSLSLTIPSVQNLAVNKATAWTSEKLGTKVSISHISYGLLNRVAVHDFYVEDFDGDTLLYVKRASAYLGTLATLPRNLTINYAKAEGGKVYLRETERGEINIKEVTDRIPKAKEKKPFRLDIRAIDGENIDFKLHRIDKHNEVGVDYADMQFLGISTHLNDFFVNGNVVGGDVENLSFVERSGFVLEKLSGSFLVDDGVVEVKDGQIVSTSTDINLKIFRIDGGSWLTYKDFINKVVMTCEVENCRIASDDIGYFAPEIWGWQTTLSNATLSMKGTISNFVGKVNNVTLEDGGTLEGSARIRGLINVPRTNFDIKVKRLDASTEEILHLLGNIAHLSISEKAASFVEHAQRINATGRFRGTIHDFKAKAKAAMAVGGNLAVECSMQNPKSGRKGLQANISASDANLAAILGNELFGPTSFTAKADVEFGDGEPLTLKSEGLISGAQLNGYNFKGVSLVADIENSRIVSSMRSADEALTMDAQAIIDLSDSKDPLYDAIVSVTHADLHAMNINKRDSISVFNGDIGVSAHGASIDELNGMLRIADAHYETIGGECSADLAELSIESNEDARVITLSSDFADAIFESRTSYKNVLYYLKNLAAHYAPLLYDEAARRNIDTHIAEIGKEVAILSFVTKDIDPLLDCITDGLEMAEGSKVEMLVSPSDNRFLMRASSEYLAHKNYLATNIDVKVGNAGDSLAISLGAADLYAGMAHFSGVGLQGGAKDNHLSLNAIFADSVRNISGELSAMARISRKNAMRHFAISLNPTYIRSGENSWDITTDGIDIDPTRIDIRNFAMRSESQELFVNGVASKSSRDSVYISLRNFSLSPLTQLTNQVGYELEGRTNGYASIRSAMSDSRIEAHIDIDSIDVNGMPVPDVVLTSRWDFGRSRASLNISTRDDGQSVIQGYYSPSQTRYYARMHTSGVNLGFLDPLLKDVISGTEGSAEVDISITGEQRAAELKGKVMVKDFATTIDYTACRYTAPTAVMNIHNNHFTIDKAPIFDKNGNKGSLSLDLSLEHLSNIEYNVNLSVNNMQVLNTTERDNPMFYGTVFASGTGTVRGDKAGVQLDFVARSEDNSTFFMPLTDKSDISSADFVTFATKDSDTTSYLVRKKMLFENRQKRHTTGSGEMDITMSLDVRPNTEVQLVIDPTVGDIIKSRGEGLLNLRVNPKANILEMYGDYTIEKGSYLFTLQNVVNKWFDIERGSTIQWTGEPLNAMLNIDAIYRLKASLQPLLQGSVSESSKSSSRAVPVECVIHLTDRLTQPTVTFDIIVPSVDSEVQSVIASTLSTPESKSQQFLYLLIANSFISESSTASASDSATTAAAVTGFEMLSNQLSNWLLNGEDKIILRYRPRTEQLSDEVDFGFSKGLINNRLLIEVEGNYIVDKSQIVNATSNFTGEAYVTWLIDQAGTLRLKGFTHTIDRFDENQGLQETGIGIYFKEDFNNSRDLRYRLKQRFKREKKENDGKVQKAPKTKSKVQTQKPSKDNSAKVEKSKDKTTTK
ncbi:MAG: translocation/assembly module TamB domain-containing protein [Alistipes sp.]|nr:translocation/assembly module TamB domain-containing protein [Alistipes sp.]